MTEALDARGGPRGGKLGAAASTRNAQESIPANCDAAASGPETHARPGPRGMAPLKAISGAIMVCLAACSSDADVASRNISQAADSFEVNRRITFYNGITGQNIMVIEGLCALGNNDTRQRMSVTCKTGPREYRRHFLGLSDNVTFFAEHLDPTSVSTARYRVFFRPSALIPDVELQQ